MTKLRDAAAQVLETLEQLNSSLHLLDCYKAFDAEITALEAALEQHDEDVAYMTDRYENWRKQKELAEANAAREQPQDCAECTKWQRAVLEQGEVIESLQDQNTELDLKLAKLEKHPIVERIPAGESDAEFQRAVEQTMCQEPAAWVESPFGDTWKTPPRREWRGVKEWEINDAIDQMPSEDVCSWSFRKGVYFAEDKLKEKNA